MLERVSPDHWTFTISRGGTDEERWSHRKKDMGENRRNSFGKTEMDTEYWFSDDPQTSRNVEGGEEDKEEEDDNDDNDDDNNIHTFYINLPLSIMHISLFRNNEEKLFPGSMIEIMIITSTVIPKYSTM
jgi:hypothetical protein